MGTSQENIKMCEKAVEIQRPWLVKMAENPRFGDIYANYCSGELIGPFFKSDKMPIPIEKLRERRYIWLPTQAQLQKVLGSSFPPLGILSRLNHVYEQNKDYWTGFESFEQLWLAFVMKEKYNKTWNGEDWIKEPTP